jgi:hypothetical protein
MSPANPNHVRHATNHVNADNPIFAREEVKMPKHVSPGHAEQMQQGKAPLPSTQTPMLNEHVEDIAEAGTVYLDSNEKPVGVSDGEKIVPLDLDKTPHHIDGSGPVEGEEEETEEEEQTPTGSEAPQTEEQQPATV